MAKVKFYDVEKNKRVEIIGELYELIAELKNKDEVFRFLFGLLTASEALMIARRIQVAKMLLEDKSYYDIKEEMGVSFQTTAKVENWLKADEKRTDLINSKIEKIEQRRKSYKNTKTYYKSLLDRYPGHRFMGELFGE